MGADDADDRGARRDRARARATAGARPSSTSSCRTSGPGCLIAGFLVAAAAPGSSSFAALFSGRLAARPHRDVLFVLFFAGFGVKAGIIPLHVWLPEAHPAAPSSISALMSARDHQDRHLRHGARLRVRARHATALLGRARASPSAALSAALGVLYALMQHDLKRLLAYHSIENIGIILLGLGAGMIALACGGRDVAAIGIAASLYHVLNHAVFKGLLFLGAGGVVMSTGTRQIEQLGGLLRRMPWTGLVFPRRRDGHFRPAAVQRLRQRVADVPGVSLRLPSTRPNRSCISSFPLAAPCWR